MPVDRRRGQRDIEGHAVVARGERLVVCPDLVAHIAVSRDAVRANEYDIDVAPTQQQSARSVDKKRIRDAALSHLPRREIRTLQPRPRLADPHMDRQPLGMREKNRRGRRAPARRR